MLHSWFKPANLIPDYVVKRIEQELFFCLKYNFWGSSCWSAELSSIHFCDFDVEEMLLRLNGCVTDSLCDSCLYVSFRSIVGIAFICLSLFNATQTCIDKATIGMILNIWGPSLVFFRLLRAICLFSFCFRKFLYSKLISRLKIHVFYSLLGVIWHPW